MALGPGPEDCGLSRELARVGLEGRVPLGIGVLAILSLALLDFVVPLVVVWLRVIFCVWLVSAITSGVEDGLLA